MVRAPLPCHRGKLGGAAEEKRLWRDDLPSAVKLKKHKLDGTARKFAAQKFCRGMEMDNVRPCAAILVNREDNPLKSMKTLQKNRALLNSLFFQALRAARKFENITVSHETERPQKLEMNSKKPSVGTSDEKRFHLDHRIPFRKRIK